MSALLATVALVVTQAASADTLRLDGPQCAAAYGATYTNTIHGSGPALSPVTGHADPFHPTNTSTTPKNASMTWCVDMYDDKASAALAAFRRAVWVTVNESKGSGLFDAKSDDFYPTSSSSSVPNPASRSLAVVDEDKDVIDQRPSVRKQDSLGSARDLAVAASVSKQEGLLMLLAGLGLMGFVILHRRK